MLTYWGLADPAYRNSSIVTTARKALVRQMREMMLAVWRESHHVCENYSPWKQETAGCTRLTVANLRPIRALASCFKILLKIGVFHLFIDDTHRGDVSQARATLSIRGVG